MQGQSIDWLEVIKVVSPFGTAIIAIIASAITAWITHRYWLKQFQIEKTYVFRQEQIRLLQEIPKKLNDVIDLVVQLKIWPMLRDLLYQYLTETESLSEEMRKGIDVIDDQLIQSQNKAAEQFSQLSTEFETMRITVGLYFGSETEKNLVNFLKVLHQGLAPNPEYDAVRNSLYIILKEATKQGESQSLLLAKIVENAKQGIEPLFAEVQRSKLQVIQGMVEYLRKAA